MFKRFFQSLKKSLKLKKLTKEYVNVSIDFQNNTAFEALTKKPSKDSIIEKIIDMAFEEKWNEPPFKKFKVNRKKLKEAFIMLEMMGCAQYARHHYVSISALMYPQTVEYIFHRDWKTREEKERMAITLINYFDENRYDRIVEVEY